MRTMDTTRKLALAAGVLYLVTFVASIPTLGLKAPVVDNADFVLGNGSTTGVIIGSLLDFVCAIAGIGTAVALYPITRRLSRTSAIGFVTTRTLEAAILVVGAMSLLSIVTLRNEATGADVPALLATSRGLLALHDWSFLFGPGFMAVLNASLLATLVYRFHLVPRWIPTLGLIGAPLLLASDLSTLFGGHGQVSGAAFVLVLPIAAWEFSLGVYMTVKGVRVPVADDGTGSPTSAPALAV